MRITWFRTSVLVVVIAAIAFIGWRMVRPMNIFAVSPAFERPISTAKIPDILQSLSANECATCHKEFFDEWKTTIHSQAWTDPYYQVDLKFDGSQQICLNCHHKDGVADKSQIKYFSHPTKDMILRSDKNKMPLLNKNNEISEFGEIACITCHNPHRWSAHKDIEEQVINTGKPEKNDSGNVLSSFLRNKEIQNSFCKDCHGIETKIKYKYYHLELSR